MERKGMNGEQREGKRQRSTEKNQSQGRERKDVNFWTRQNLKKKKKAGKDKVSE